jgi:predicted dehydrogenase
VLKAAEKGKHILVEKPLALNTMEVQQMMDATKKTVSIFWKDFGSSIRL